VWVLLQKQQTASLPFLPHSLAAFNVYEQQAAAAAASLSKWVRVSEREQDEKLNFLLKMESRQ